MQKNERGFTLIELVTVIILIGIMSVTLFSRMTSITSTTIQAGRDDVIAALFFAQQTAMARSGIRVVLTSSSISVTENNVAIVVHSKGYPLSMPTGVTLTSNGGAIGSSVVFVYDKLGRIPANSAATTIGLSSSSGASASVILEASGYAH